MKREYIFLGIIIAIVFFLWINSGDRDADLREYNSIANPRLSIQDRVAEDAVNRYMIAAREGNRMHMLSQAGMCSTAFLQAKNEDGYRYWRHIEDSLSHSLGLPTYR